MTKATEEIQHFMGGLAAVSEETSKRRGNDKHTCSLSHSEDPPTLQATSGARSVYATCYCMNLAAKLCC